MDKLLELYQKLCDAGVSFFTWDIEDKAATTIEMAGRYAVFMDFDCICTRKKELAVLAHEGGHIMTGATHRICSPYDLIAKHEYKADKWAVQEVIPKDKLDAAVAEGYTDLWDLAEKFNVPEDFMRKAICWYENGNLDVELGA